MFLDAILLHCFYKPEPLWDIYFFLLDAVPTGLAGIHLTLHFLNWNPSLMWTLSIDACVFALGFQTISVSKIISDIAKYWLCIWFIAHK